MNHVTTSVADLHLLRYPQEQGAREPLRAWDAADEYLLRHVAGLASGQAADAVAHEPVDLGGTVVVFGDRWGALVTALAAHAPVQVTDSYLTREATRANLARIGAPQEAVRLASTTEELPERIDVLLVRVPKSLALLEDQLCRLAARMHAGTVVVGAGMVTEVHTSTLELFERIIGPTRTSLAVRKARLIFSVPDFERPRAASPWPRSLVLPQDAGAAAGRTVVNHAGVFSGEHLDIGARFFLKHLPRRLPARIVDLGCGNGVLGLAAALANPQAQVTFVDESYHAVASASDTMRVNGADPAGRARFLVQDGLEGYPAQSVDLVLNNPPFHSHQAITDATAWRMFTGSRAALCPGGELWVVGNRHLGYHLKLRRLFGNCQVVASDPKFVVLRAVR